MRISKANFPFYNNEIKIKSRKEKETFKQVPYFSIKHGDVIENNNCELRFPNNDLIVCRHLASQYALDVLNNIDRGKVDMLHYTGSESMACHVQNEMELYYSEIIEKAKTVYVINNNDFGRVLTDIFKSMEKEGKTHLALLLQSYNHAMAVRLSIKGDSKPYYVINFYDPNLSNLTLRRKTDNLLSLKDDKIEDYIEQDRYNIYYTSHDHDMTSIFICEDPNVLAARPLKNDRKLTLINDPILLAPSKKLVMILLDGGLIIDAIKVIKKMLMLLVNNMFHVNEPCYSSVIRSATALGEPSVVTAYGKLLEGIPEEQRPALLEAKDNRGTPALYFALQNGHADAIKAWGEFLAGVPKEQIPALLAAIDTRGMPGLHMALLLGHADAIKAWGELLVYVPKEQIPALLVAKDNRGAPALYFALQDGHADAIKAWGELLVYVPKEQIYALLAAYVGGIPGLHMVLRRGRADAIKAWGELLVYVPKEQIPALLAAKDILGTPALYFALQNGHADAIKAWGELLAYVPKEQIPALLAANAQGMPGLHMALQNGHADAIKAWGKLLELIPIDQRAELLGIKNPTKDHGFYEAIKRDDYNTVIEFFELLRYVSPSEEREFIAAKDENGDSLLALCFKADKRYR
ncbi:ShET2/EspL2 family type III secretion system effector toxin [Yersinia enterocolitica]